MSMTFGPELAMCVEAALRDAGVAPGPVFDTMGLTKGQLTSPTLGQTARMIRLAADGCEDPAFGLHVAEKVRVTPFELAAYIAESRWTAREALALGDVFLVSRETAAHFSTDERLATWTIDPIDGRIDRHAAEFALLCLCGAAHRALSGWRPSAVRFRHPRPRSIDEHLRLFRIEPSFEQSVDGVECAVEWMDLPLSPDPALLREAIDRQMLAFRHRAAERPSVAERVRNLLSSDLPGTAPTRTDVARRLAMSTRTLHRRLADEGWSYSRLLDEVRRQRALELLLVSDVTAARVSFELGFATEAAFYRAFKRWTGRTPADYRHDVVGAPCLSPGGADPGDARHDR